MQLLALLLIGFSLFTAALLIIGNILQKLEPQQYLAKLAGFSLVSSLAAIQWLNLQFIVDPTEQEYSLIYVILLYCIAPCFYFYSYRLLTVDVRLSSWHFLHVLPVALSLFTPFSWVLPVAFLIGSGYLLWLGKVVYSLRKQRLRFRQELFVLALFFSIAIAAVVLGFILPLVSKVTFITWYSILIGLAFFAAALTLLRFPTITDDIAEAVQAAYAESSLKKIDRENVLAQLRHLMEQEKLYTQDNLSLTMLAEQLALTSHQLSELINTEFQQGFSKYIRQHRIEEAKKMLLAEPTASVLSIGLSVGFSTQSNFYTAFRDISGMPPGKYRKQFANQK